MTKIVVLNVGANKKNPGVRGPIYADGSFKFIPIIERPGYHGPTYRELNLEEYVPKDCLDKVAHPDPEFVSFTYGHVMRVGDKKKIRQLESGDYLFFLATLDYVGSDKKRPKWINPHWGAYLIGYFRIQQILERTEFVEQSVQIQKLFQNNAHYEDGKFLGDIAIKGDENSALLRKAHPLSHPLISHLPNELTKTTFLTDWLSKNPGKEPRGWYRWVLSCSNNHRIAKLWKEIDEYNPNQSKKALYP